MPPLAGLFRKPPADLTQIAIRRGGWFPEALIREIIDGRLIAHGRGDMPVWGRTLSERQMILITEHLYSLQMPRSEKRGEEGPP